MGGGKSFVVSNDCEVEPGFIITEIEACVRMSRGVHLEAPKEVIFELDLEGLTGMCQIFQARAEEGHCRRMKSMDKTPTQNSENDFHRVSGRLNGSELNGR